MMIDRLGAIAICQNFEGILRNLGWHVGLTGSCLYGPSPAADNIDIIVYPHVAEDGSKSNLSPQEVLSLIGVTDVTHTESDQWYGGWHVDYIYVGRHESIKVDAFFLK